MNGESVIQNEVGQKEKYKYCILTHMESTKVVLMNYSQVRNRGADIKNELADTEGEEKGGKN